MNTTSISHQQFNLGLLANTITNKYLKLSNCFLLMVLILSGINSLSAQTMDTTNSKPPKKIDLKIMPYISYNRTLGAQIGVVPMAMYKINNNDTISPQSISGGVAMYTGNKSWFLVQFNKLYFDQDRYRFIVAYGGGSFNSQTYLELPFLQDFVDFNVDAFFFKAELQRKIIPQLYGGINYSYSRMNTKMDPNKLPGATPELSELNNVGLMAMYDTRNSVYYPTNGLYITGKYQTSPAFLGNDSITNTLGLEVSKYIGLHDNRDVLALHFVGGIGLGNLSFNQQFVLGGRYLRGYTQGKFRGRQISSLQAEYRWNFSNKLGLVGFGGAAMVFNGDIKADNGRILPGGGFGVRYVAFPKTHMNVGLDLAVGVDDWGLNFKIGEAF